MGDGSSLRVYKTSTGAAVATLNAPAGLPFLQLASGGTGTSFLAAAGTDAAASTGCNTSYYKFQLSTAGQPSKLTLVRKMPAGWLSTGVAASPGGATFAYTAVHCFHPDPIGVIGITGQAGNRSWTYDLSEDTPSSLAASADGETLAFQGFVSNTQQDGLLLNTDSAATTVMGASRVVIKGTDPVSMEISPDGKTIYACSNPTPGTDSGNGVIASYSAATGQRLKVLRKYSNVWCNLSANATGKFLLASLSTNSGANTLIGLDLLTGTSVTLKIHPTFQLVDPGTKATW